MKDKKLRIEDALSATKAAVEEGVGDQSVCPFLILGSQSPGGKYSSSHAYGEAYSLDYGHYGEYYAYCSGSAGSDLGYKVGVCHVVYGGYQHGDYGRNSKFWYKCGDRSLCHHLKLSL